MCWNPGAAQYAHRTRSFRMQMKDTKHIERSILSAMFVALSENSICFAIQRTNWVSFVRRRLHLGILRRSHHAFAFAQIYAALSYARCTLNRLMGSRTSYIFFASPVLDTTELFFVPTVPVQTKGKYIFFIFIHHSEARNAIQFQIHITSRIQFRFIRLPFLVLRNCASTNEIKCRHTMALILHDAVQGACRFFVFAISLRNASSRTRKTSPMCRNMPIVHFFSTWIIHFMLFFVSHLPSIPVR